MALRKFLDPSLTQLERALLARAARLQKRGGAMPPGPEADVLLAVSAEFTELAGELHEDGR